MKTTTFKNKIFNTALLSATCAITLCAQQAFAFGMMGGAVGAHVGGIGSGRPESSGSRAGAANEAGSVTMNGITVMANGTVIVPAVTPRVPNVATPSDLRQLNQQQTTGGPCRTNDCAAY